MNTDVEFTESNQMKPMSGMAVTGFVMALLFCIPVLPVDTDGTEVVWEAAKADASEPAGSSGEGSDDTAEKTE